MRGALAAIALASCTGGTIDDRPRTTAYVTKTVLAGTCGQAQCHSSFANAHGYALDTVESVKNTLRYEITHGSSFLINADTDPQNQALANVLNQTDNSRLQNLYAMPLDAPMPEADVALILDWMARGTPGACELTAPLCAFPLQLGAEFIATCGPDHEYIYSDPQPGQCP